MFDMLSMPPAITTSLYPLEMLRAANIAAFMPDAQTYVKVNTITN